ncbi:unnamed protein product [Arctogadus glacialis]
MLLIRNTPPVTHEEEPSTSTSSQPAPANVEIPSTTDINLWETLDRDASGASMSRNATVDATVGVQRYMTDPPLERSEEPLEYRINDKNVSWSVRLMLESESRLCG